MSRAQGNEPAKGLLDKYKDSLDNAPIGKKYQDCFDIDTGLPCQEYVDLYGEVTGELRAMGFDTKARPAQANHEPCHD